MENYDGSKKMALPTFKTTMMDDEILIPKNAGAGRPKLDVDQETVYVGVKVTLPEKALLMRVADELGYISMSALLRTILRSWLKFYTSKSSVKP